MKPLPCLTFLALAVAQPVPSASAQMTQTWLAEHDGVLSDDDYARDVAVDALGNSYVVGSEYELVPPNLFSPSFVTVKYDPQGNEEWVRIFHAGPANTSSAAWHAACAPNGDVLVAGAVNTGSDWAVVRYDPTGAELWSYVHPVGTAWLSHPLDLAVDAAGDVYVLGDSGLGGTEWLLFRVTAGGALDWEYTDNGGGQGASGQALAVDSSNGAVYVVGRVKLGSLDTQIALQRLDAQGALVWQRTYGITGSLTLDEGTDVALDPSGDVLLCGTIYVDAVTGYDVIAMRHDPAGALEWQGTWGSLGDVADVAEALALAPAGGVAVVGTTEVSDFDDDALVVMFDASGTPSWVQTFGGDALGWDAGAEVAVDGIGRVVVTGDVVPSGLGRHSFVAQYDVDGTLLFEELYGDPLGTDTYAFALADLPDGRSWVAGDSSNSAGDSDIITIHYVPTGTSTYCIGASNSAGPGAAIDASGTVTISANDFTLEVQGAIAGQFGLFYYGPNPIQVPFGNGWRCVGGGATGTFRLSPAAPVGPGGSLSRLVDFTQAPAGSGPGAIEPGSIWNFQFWYRDPAAGGASFNLSNALTATFEP